MHPKTPGGGALEYESDGYFVEKKGSSDMGSKKIGPFGVWTSQNKGSFGVNWVKFEWKFAIFSWRLMKIFEMRAKRAKDLKLYVEIMKKGGHWVWTVEKNGSIGCAICVEKGVYWQADDIGWHMGVPPPGPETNCL